MTTKPKANWPGWAVLGRQWRLGLLTYALTVVASLPTALAVGTLMGRYFEYRQVADDVSARLAFVPLVEVSIERSSTFSTLFVIAAATSIIWWIVHTFVVGAVLGGGRMGTSVSLSRALSLGGQHFWGLLTLSVLGLPFVLSVAAGAFYAADAVGAALTKGWNSEASMMVVRIVLGFVALVVTGWAAGTHDLMRARKVDGAGVLRAFGFGLVRGLTGPGRLLGRCFPWLVASLILTVVISWVDAQTIWSSPTAIAGGVLLQQGLVLIRVFLRMAGLASVQGLVAAAGTK